jgi:type I restriction-modification system DNA methylase subunit
MISDTVSEFQIDANDLALTAAHVGQLENADAVIRFFAQLRYAVDAATEIPHQALGLEGDDVRLDVRRLWRIGSDPDMGDIVLYLMEVRSVTVALVQRVARRFHERSEQPLLVLTSDYETLDFVLIDRSAESSNQPGKPFKFVVRPRQITVTRRKPTPVNLRVLRRLTFTESDSGLQWEKLRAAFTTAEWTEEHFNNRALFADHYLKTRLADATITPEWAVDVGPIGRELYKLLATARQTFGMQPEATIRTGLYEPIFRLLGFDFVQNKPGDSDGTAPDYFLYAPGDRSKPLAAALTHVWNRNLDDIDPTRDQETGNEIPGALVVSTLEAGQAPWVIATNGKLWRLYAAQADNKATNYYEVDLEEAFAAEDRVTAIKYWWLLFRAAAFTGFLDKVRRESQEYAAALGKRLKNRVFEEIFPRFAEGLIVQMRAEKERLGDRRLEIGEADAGDVGWRSGEIDLEQVFQATLTFLYRLMFVAYAESMELLPLTEAHGYGAVSLRQIKAEVAAAGGEVEEDAPKKLAKAYAASDVGLYTRLQQLFKAIDAGDPALNLPAYNGGLFSAETAAGRLLARYAIPDRFLAQGLDRLCRDVDEKTHALVFVDFKSLGVRHLGSIYEGLLEFKLRIAAEKLAVVKEDGKELYAPLAKVKNRRTVATLNKGDVYLENDKRERKATGSYYTPDYIVKYIVEHTVGPVLERKFATLAPLLRDAQQRYRKAKELAQKKGEDPEKFWNSPEMQQLADACLDVKVLDPAMGSGHFLVEAVDFISDRLIDWLNGWSDNPVWAMLARIRSDILDDMARQQVTIPAERLVRVALLKRAVLKRCIYGVDLNAMAVELAKVSLWLDAFTLGAPLSFLDHHLKQGNSLIGSRIGDVQAALAGKQQRSLFASNKFAGVMLATDLMRQVSYLSDNTVQQVVSSRSAYRSAADYLAPFKRILDVYTSRWFGNPPTRNGFDPTLEFLQRDDVQGWLENPAQPLPPDDYMNVRQVAATALAAAADKSFFHWELEFPEVFFAPSTPGGQDVALREDGGFDAVVGNPPYLFITEIEPIVRTYLQENFGSVQYRFDIYASFVELAVELIVDSARFGYIIPHTLLNNNSFQALRRFLINVCGDMFVTDFSEPVFSDAANETMIFVGHKAPDAEAKLYSRLCFADPAALKGNYVSIPARLLAELPGEPFLVRNVQWIQPLLDRFTSNLESAAKHIRATQGLRTGNNDTYISRQPRGDAWRPVVSGSDIDRYEIFWPGTYVLYDRQILDAPRDPIFWSAAEKLIVQEIRNVHLSRRIVLGYDTNRLIALNTTNAVVLQSASSLSLRFIAAIFSSHLLNEFCRSCFVDNHIATQYLEALPIPRIAFLTETTRRTQLAEKARKLYQRCLSEGHACLLDFSRHHLDLGESDVVHDLLAFLAEQMIDLNKRKQAEVKRFLAWLEGRLAILPKNGETGIDSLTGKTTLQNYLGDYQKGEPACAWADFFYRLHQNHRRFRVSLEEVKGEIEREFARSLAVLLPIKAQLATTDTLIDKIVYQLYGLTDAEIEIIERPHYEQALADAKQQVLGDKNLADDEARLAALGEKTLAAGQRLQERINLAVDEAALAAALPGVEWLTAEARTFLVGAEYDLRTRPEQLDFSATVVGYAKAVEQMLGKRLFERFRDESGATAADCANEHLQRYLNGGKPPTLAVMSDIVRSAKEQALRAFAQRIFANAHVTIFGDDGVAGLLADKTIIELRNRAAHDTVLTRADALTARAWALAILARL